jgi:hypothetical protein
MLVAIELRSENGQIVVGDIRAAAIRVMLKARCRLSAAERYLQRFESERRAVISREPSRCNDD